MTKRTFFLLPDFLSFPAETDEYHGKIRLGQLISDIKDPGHPIACNALLFRQYVLMPLMIFIVLLAIWVAPTTNRAASFTNPSYISDPLPLAVGATGSLRSFWNGVVFITIGMKARKGQMELHKAAASNRM